MSECGSAGTTAAPGGDSGNIGSEEERRQRTADDDEPPGSPWREPNLELPPPRDAPPLSAAEIDESTEEMEDAGARDARKRMENDLRGLGDAPSEEPPPPLDQTIDALDEETGDGTKKGKREIAGSDIPAGSETHRDSFAGDYGSHGASATALRADHPRHSLEDPQQHPPTPPPTIEIEAEVRQPPSISLAATSSSSGTSTPRNNNQGRISPTTGPPPPSSTSAQDAQGIQGDIVGAPTLPSVCEVEATLVDAEVYQATRLTESYFDRADAREEIATPSSHRVKYIVVGLTLIIGAMAGAIGTLLALVNRGENEGAADNPTKGSDEVVTDAPARGGEEDDIDDVGDPSAVGVHLPSHAPSVHSSSVPSVFPTPGFCFQDKTALQAAVNDYVSQRCVYDRGCAVGQIAGWPMNSWCVSQVTDMSSLFKDMETFNEDISSWDTANVRTMSEMFRGASAFNGDLSSWNVSSVSEMDQMFRLARAFNGNVTSWNVSRVTAMQQLFMKSSVFNGDVSLWDVSRVTHMGEMFNFAELFNSDLSSWDVSSVTNMWFMFYFARTFDQDLSAWNMSNVYTISGMFWSADKFNSDLSGWDTSSITHMSSAFYYAKAFNSDISSWNITSVGYVAKMFHAATSFNQNLCAWSDRFPYSEADDIFLDSGCTFTDSPERLNGGPFCASSCS